MNKNLGWIVAAIVAIAAGYFYKYPNCAPCPECPDTTRNIIKPVIDNRQALLSLAEIALNRKAKSQAELESLVKFDKEFYLAFFNRYDYKSELGKQYYYARHGSCCPCSTGGRDCCACVGGSAFGAPTSASLRAAFNSNGSTSLYTLASYSSQQKTERKQLKLDKKSIDTTDIFFVPPGTPDGKYFVKFEGKINVVLDIDVNGDGSFEVVEIR